MHRASRPRKMQKKLDKAIAPVFDLRKQCRNKKVIVIGDLHGCFDELNELLNNIGWSAETHITILTGDLVDRGPKIKETLLFAMNTPNVYSLMSNHEWKLLRYIWGRPIEKGSLAKTIEQCGETFLREPSFVNWLELLPYIIRWSDDSYVVHAGIRPDRPINRQRKEHCIYIRTWNPKTQEIWDRQRRDPWWFEYQYLSSSLPLPIKVFFGHQQHEKPWVSSWACSLDGGLVFGGSLRAYLDGHGLIELKARQAYEMEENFLSATIE